MYLLLAGVGIVAALIVAWPCLVRWRISSNPDTGGEFIGGQVYLVAAAFIAGLWVVLVCSKADWGWWDPEPAFRAVLTTTAFMFGYGQFIPSTYYATFERADDGKYVSRLGVPQGESRLKIVIYNTGIISWRRYRISVEALNQTPADPNFTFSSTSEKLQVSNNGTLIQWNGDLLVVGEPAVATFHVMAAIPGEHRLRIRVATAFGGERHNYRLKIMATESPAPASP